MTAVTDPARAATRADGPAAARGTSDNKPDTHAPAPQPLAALILDQTAAGTWNDAPYTTRTAVRDFLRVLAGATP